MTEQLFLQRYSQLPETLQQEMLAFLDYLLFKQQVWQPVHPLKTKKTPPKKAESVITNGTLTDLQRLLLEAPDMTEEEHNVILEKRKALNQWN